MGCLDVLASFVLFVCFGYFYDSVFLMCLVVFLLVCLYVFRLSGCIFFGSL